MTTRTFASLIPKLNPSVPGCPQYTMIQYIRDAAIRVCERTLAWRYVQPTFDLLPGIHRYPYRKPTQTAVHVLFDAMVNDNPLERLVLEDALYRYPEWADLYSGEDPADFWKNVPPGTYNSLEFNSEEYNSGEGVALPEEALALAEEPRIVTQLTPDEFIVLPLPDDEKTYTIRMFFALKPTREADGMDKEIMDELEEAILHGALQHLLVLPNVNWSDRELASYHAKQFLREVTARRARANLGVMRGSLIATAPRFA